MHEHEIDHITLVQAIDHVAERTAKHQTIDHAHVAIPDMKLAQLDDDENGESDREAHQKPALPATGIIEHRKRSAFVMPTHPAEDRQDGNPLTRLEDAHHPPLAQLIRDHHPSTQTQPAGPAEAGRAPLHIVRRHTGSTCPVPPDVENHCRAVRMSA